MGNHITWAHCNFEEPNEFDTKFCEKRIADESYAFKYYKRAPSEKDPTCMDIQYREKCHEDISTNITHFKQRMYKQCAGLNEVKMPHAESLDIDIKAPVFDLAGMEKIKGQFVLAQEIFLQCPRCKVRSRQFKVNEDGKDVCVVKVNTTKKGWPAFAEDCDDVIQIVHASQNCQ
uniref:Uncharacterized protein n=1 Tax=Panagrolaimus sp. ES5 TaxID=591445 RepID=A0AC34GSX1_9BILA